MAGGLMASRNVPPKVGAARARLAGLVAHREPDDPAIEEARRDLAVENLATHIKRVTGAAPPLPPEHAAYLRGLLPYPEPEAAS